MNIKTNLIFYPNKVIKEVFPFILTRGSKELGNSKKLNQYGISLREIFGLCVSTTFRKKLDENKQWVFSTDPKLSDDGIIATIGNGNKLSYYEILEQVYLPGKFLERDQLQSMNDYVLKHVYRTKDKGAEYRKNTSLLILGDIQSVNNSDRFEWQDFVNKFFAKESFLHLYFLSLVKHADQYNEYYLLSFTNQKHRQNLNGEFNIKISSDGEMRFKCLQKINLLKK